MLTVITPASSRDLTTLETLKAYLSITGSAQDTALALAIRQASDAITRYVGQTFARERVQQTERHCHSSGSIILDRSFAVTLNSVTYGDTALAATDWTLEGAVLRPYPYSYQARYWSYGEWIIDYWSGYELIGELPYDVERACLLACAGWQSGRGRDPLIRSETAEGVGSVSYAVTTAAGVGQLPAEALALLEPYRRLFP